MAKSAQYTDEWFIEKGYTFDPQSKTYIPPKGDYENAIEKVRHSLKKPLSTKGCEVIGEVVVKQKVNNSPDFDIIKPCTEWFIKGASVPSKKNSRLNFVRNGRQISIPSKKHAEYITITKSQYEAYGIEFRRAVEYYKLSYPLYIEFTFIRGSKHSFDLCNACQTCEDIMKDEVKKGQLIKKGWIPDDSADYIIPVFKPYEYDKNNPGVRIKLILQ